MRETRCRFLIIAGLLAACSATSRAQTFYKWTDERGIVHFADEPPPGAKGVEQRNLPVPPAGQPVPADAAGDGEEAKSADAAAKKLPAGSGPAQIVLVSHQVIRNGPRAAHVFGEVKNVGGTDAEGVAVTLTAVDATQGTPCLDEQAMVNPSTVPAGETGNFDVDLDNPCLAGDTPVDVAPVWK